MCFEGRCAYTVPFMFLPCLLLLLRPSSVPLLNKSARETTLGLLLRLT